MIYVVAVAAVAVLASVWFWLGRRHPAEGAPSDTPPTAARPSRISSRLGAVLRRELDASFWSDLEDGLIEADVGVETAASIVHRVRAATPTTTDEARRLLRVCLVEAFEDRDRTLHMEGAPAVVVVVGVNGSGKTTTIAKLAAEVIDSGRSALVAAADTFRAAAAEQMKAWGERIGFDVVRGSDRADPAAVAFDGLGAARARGRDVLFVDTAGRLHSKQNLMDELSKIVRVLSTEADGIEEILLVVDGSSGQNVINQARAFTDAVGVTGVAITKLDGSAKGGVVVAVERDLGIPVKLVGVGEGAGDLLHFDPSSYVDDLLAET